MLMFHFLFKPQRHFNFSFPGLIWYQDPGKSMQGMLAPLKSICKSFVKSVCLTMWNFFLLFLFPKLIFFTCNRGRYSFQRNFCTNWIQCKMNQLPFCCACLFQNIFDKKGAMLIYKCRKHPRKDCIGDFIKSNESMDLNKFHTSWLFDPSFDRVVSCYSTIKEKYPYIWYLEFFL